MSENRYNESIVSGRNAVRELLSSGRDIDKIYIQKGAREGSVKLIAAEALDRKIPIVTVEKAKLDAMCQGTSHQGVAALAAEKNYSTLDDIIEYADSLGEKPFVVICDGVEDPHNLGAILRSAE